MGVPKITCRSLIIPLAISVLFILLNSWWLINYSPEINSEDMLILGKSIAVDNFISDGGTIWGASHIYYSEPILPLIFFIGLHANSPAWLFILNDLFILALIPAIYIIAAKMYGKSTGVAASFMAALTPAVLVFSRTLYPELANMALLCICFIFFIRSSFFRKPEESFAWLTVSVISVLIKYSMLSYAASFLVAGIILYFYQRLVLKKKRDAREIRFKAGFYLLCISLAAVYILTSAQVSEVGSKDSKLMFYDKGYSLTSFLCESLNYPYLMIQTQLGFIGTLLLCMAIIEVIYRILKKAAPLEEIAVLLIISSNFAFYSYIVPIVNAQVTSIFIPLCIVLLAGFIMRRSIGLRIFLSILMVISFALLFIGGSSQHLLEISPLEKLPVRLGCTRVDNRFALKAVYLMARDTSIGKTGVFDFTRKPDTQAQLASIIAQGKGKMVRILDLTTYDYSGLGYYSWLNKTYVAIYQRCPFEPDIDYGEYLKDFDYVLLSDRSYTTLNISGTYKIRTEYSYVCENLKLLVIDGFAMRGKVWDSVLFQNLTVYEKVG